MVILWMVLCCLVWLMDILVLDVLVMEKDLKWWIINGQVIEVDGEMFLIGVIVMVKGILIGIVIDIDGNYSVEVLEIDVLIFLYIGY